MSKSRRAPSASASAPARASTSSASAADHPTPPWAKLRRLCDEGQILFGQNSENILREDGMVGVTVDLRGADEGSLVGFRARRDADVVDVENIGYYEPQDFWEPIHSASGPFILEPNDFYILMTREAVGVPPDYAAEMLAYDITAGEFRVHYAGFFDPGFGWDAAQRKAGGSRAVLEVRSYEVPFVLEHGQTVGWLRYEPMAGRPDKLYGQDIKSNYQGQSLKLAKQFRPLS